MPDESASRQGGPNSESDLPPRINWRVVVWLFVVATVLRFAYFYLDDLTRQQGGTFVRRVLEELTGGGASLLLFPIVVYLERRFPLDRGRWRRTWAVHLAGFVVYSLAHTTVMAVSRALIFPSLGLGPYDYGLMSIRFVMESTQDVISYVSFIGILTLIRVQQRERAEEVRAVDLARAAADARLEVLGLRLQPHFLFNALNTISSAVYDDPAAADEMIGHLGDLLRCALRSADRPEVSVAEELETLRAYLALVEARFGDRLQCRLDIDESANLLGVPALLLQPLVENAVRHGASIETADDIVVALSRSQGRLVIVVENALDHPVSKPIRLGTGLAATRDRLALMYGPEAQLETSAESGRFRVTIRIPERAAERGGHSDSAGNRGRSELTERVSAGTHR